MSWRILRLLGACAILAAVGAPACGGNASDPQPQSAGNAGSGARAGSGGSSSIGRAGTAGTTDSPPVKCGNTSCSGVVIPIQNFSVPGCCADAATSHCGLDSSVLATFGPTFADACQPLAQPGSPDATCPMSPSAPVQGSGLTIQFPGCCRANHTCGYDLDKVAGVFEIGLGCVDATPFLDGGTPQSCGEDGAAGAAGAAGAGGDSSGAGAGGDTGGLPGAGGDSGTAGAGG